MTEMRHWIDMLTTPAMRCETMRHQDCPPLPPSPANIEQARQFVWRKWRDRAAELGRARPADLSGACKFASLFAQHLFGGHVRGNTDHQFVLLDDGQVIDLTAGAADVAGLADPYRHDRRFWNNPEHRASLVSCQTRVARWVAEFCQSRAAPSDH